MIRLYTLLLLSIPVSASFAATPIDTSNTTHATKAPSPALPWQKQQDVINNHIKGAQLAKMKATTNALLAFLDSSLTGAPVNPVWHGEYSIDKIETGIQAKYGIRSSFAPATSNAPANTSTSARAATAASNAARAASAATSSLDIMANDLSPLLGQIEVYRQPYLTLPPVLAVRNECPYFEPGATQVSPVLGAESSAATTTASAAPAPTGTASATSAAAASATSAAAAAASATSTSAASAAVASPSSEAGPRTRFWLVTARPDELPYIIVSRKEYLLQVQTSLNRAKEKTIALVKEKNHIRPATAQESEKKKELESLSTLYAGAELQMRTKMYLDRYKTDEENINGDIAVATADQDTLLHVIDRMLHKLSPETLKAPAVIPATAKEFEGFSDGEAGSVMLVRPNPAFTDLASGLDKARFFLISWTYNPADGSSATIDRQIGEKMDTRTLKGLL